MENIENKVDIDTDNRLLKIEKRLEQIGVCDGKTNSGELGNILNNNYQIYTLYQDVERIKYDTIPKVDSDVFLLKKSYIFKYGTYIIVGACIFCGGIIFGK